MASDKHQRHSPSKFEEEKNVYPIYYIIVKDYDIVYRVNIFFKNTMI